MERLTRTSSAPGPRHAWWLGAAIAVGLLLLPLIAWFVFPSVDRAPPVANASAVEQEEEEEEEEDSTAPKGKRTVAGSVVDQDGNPAARVRVSVRAKGKPLGSGITKEDGTFELKVASGEATITATSTLMGTATADVPPSGDVLDLQLTLQKGDSPAGNIAGTVVDAQGNGIAEAYVVCESDPTLSAVSSETGAFSLPSGAEGCSATASHPDHGTSPGVSISSTGKNRIEMPSPGKISGNVVDEKGKAFTSFTIGIESFTSDSGDRDSPFFRQKKFDDPGGEFVLDNLAPGKYVLSATVTGRPPAKSKQVEVSSGARARGVTITVGKGTTLSGTVTDRESGKPVEGVRVRLDAAVIGGSAGSATTDTQGKYTLEGVPGGPFSARFSHRDYKDRILSLDGSTGALTGDVDLGKKGDGSDMEMSGIGATLISGQKFVEVGSIVPGGPAEGAGLEAGDQIQRIEGKTTEGLPVNDCVQKLRGPEGTKVTVTVGRGTRRFDLTITRAIISR